MRWRLTAGNQSGANMKSCWYILIVLFISIEDILAGEQIRFTHMTNNDGLPSNTVVCTVRDNKGYFWYGTKNGLCRYDGDSFEIFESIIQDTTSISGNSIYALFEDSRKTLWVATNNGVCKYIRKFNNFHTVPGSSAVRAFAELADGTILVATSQGVRELDVNADMLMDFGADTGNYVTVAAFAIVEDGAGDIWVATAAGICVIDPKNRMVRKYKHDAHDMRSLSSNDVSVIFRDSDDGLWIGTRSTGISRYDSKNDSFVRISGLSHTYVHDISEKDDGELWIGTEKGLNIYDRHSGKIRQLYNDIKDPYSLNDNSIYCVMNDGADNMIVGTYFGGINIHLKKYEQFTVYTQNSSTHSLSGKVVRQISCDKIGNLWIATEDGGLNYFDRKSGLFRTFKYDSSTNSVSSNNVHAVITDRDGDLWIGTYLGGVNHYDKRTGRFMHYTRARYPTLYSDSIFALLQDRSGQIWIGTTGGIVIFDKHTGRFERIREDLFQGVSVEALYEDSKGNIWLGTRNAGVYKYDKTRDVWENFDGAAKNNVERKPIWDKVNNIFEDRKGYIWIATHYGGLNRIDNQTGEMVVYYREDGLPSNSIFGIIEDHNGYLWITTNNGLTKFDPESRDFVTYTTADGLPNNQFNYNSSYRADDGTLFFGTIDGMISLNPEDILAYNTPPLIDVSGFFISGKKMYPGSNDSVLQKVISETDRIVLLHNQANSFSFELASPSLLPSNNVSFVIKLEGADDEWIDLGHQRQITYVNLPAGDYVFMVRASHTSGNVASDIKTIKIKILPPFWKSHIAIIGYLLLGLILAYVIFRIIVSQQREKHQIMMERLETKKLKEVSQLKINFFSNISHELRTPLTLIMSPVQNILTDPNLDAELRKKMLLVNNNAQRMQSLIDELIWLSKIESGQQCIRAKKGFIFRFIIEICQGFRLLAEDKGIHFSWDITIAKDPVFFDPSMVEKIIYNLLSNAFKYTPRNGEVKLIAGLVCENNAQFAKIEVKDTGEGISEEELPYIFDKYYQAKDKSEKSGFGIGLNMVRQLTYIHKGHLDVVSRPGTGSTFTVYLNVDSGSFSDMEKSSRTMDNKQISEYQYLPVEMLNESDDIILETVSEDAAGLGRKGKHILIVEDNAELLQYIASIFDKDYRTTLCTNGSLGYTMALEILPDLIISDVMMPEIDGLELCRMVKGAIELCHIPFILLTAKTGEENQLDGYDCGADAYLEKPFNPIKLQRKVHNILATADSYARRLRNKATISFDDGYLCSRDRQLLESIRSYILEHLSEERLSILDITRNTGISRTLLHLKLRKLTGLSTTEFINKIRLEEAAKMLCGDRNISEIAYASGFSSPNYFARCFRRFYGKSPSEYRQQNYEN